MNTKISTIEYIELGIKFNQLNIETKKIICESFQIEYVDNNIQLNQKFIRKLYTITFEEILKLKLIIDKEIKDDKIIEQNINIKTEKKRNYIEYSSNKSNIKDKKEKEESSSEEEVLKDKKGNIILKMKKKVKYDRLLKEKEHYYYTDKENKEWSFT